MKNRIILLVALVFAALPIAAGDYLTIHFKDGHTERHFMHLVENIGVTKYDLEGNLHSEYQMQQIVMADTTYSYYLSDIESMSFKKVDDEQVNDEVENAVSSLESIVQQSTTFDDIKTHVDEIKQLDGVEDVSCEGHDIVVKFRDWYSVYIVYHPAFDNQGSNLAKLSNSLKRISKKRLAPVTNDGSPVKVAIAFQMMNDVRFADEKEQMKSLKDQFSEMGFDVHFIPDEESGEVLDVDFYKRRMFDYNIVCLDTHGCYSNGKHGLLTGDRLPFTSSIKDALKEEIFDMEDVGIGFCKAKDENDWFFSDWAMFTRVSEDFIKKSTYKFEGAGPHIVFCGACESLKGNDILTRKHNGVEESYYGSSSLADIFLDKGADAYIGYNNYTAHSSDAAAKYFYYLLNGASLETAFYHLPKNRKNEDDTDYNAALIDLFKQNSEYDDPKSIFLFKTFTEAMSDQDANNEFKESGQVELKGKTYIYNIEGSGVRFGIRYGTESDVDKQSNYREVYSNNKHYSGAENGEVDFSALIQPVAGEKYYYRAFTDDGIHYNWGEEKSFTIEAAPVYPDLQVSETQLSIVDGNSITVEITAGSGEYGVTNNNPGVATSTVSGTTITVNTHKPGDATITVKDLLSGQTITITVIVTEKQSGGDIPAYTSCPDSHHPHLIDLGLPSGTKWACCNVGASKPEEYGGYFSWGETTEKSTCDWSTYIHCDGSSSTCHDIGKDIAGTQYDAATANWGSPWVMPNKEQMEELENSCTSEWTTENGVNGRRFTGPNGASIFLPAAGRRWYDGLSYAGSWGRYWSSTLDESSKSYAWYLYFTSWNMNTSSGGMDYGNRYFGYSVRPVRKN